MILNKYISFCALITFCVLSPSLFAAVYKQVDEQGNISYSDVPQKKDDQPISMPEPMTFTSKPAPKSSGDGEGNQKRKSDQQSEKYDSVAINSPNNDETIRSNNGDVTVQISSTPGLQNNHLFVLFMDGNKVQESAATSVQLTNLERGTHTLTAEIQDDQSNTLASSPPVSFHLQRQTAPRPAPFSRKN